MMKNLNLINVTLAAGSIPDFNFFLQESVRAAGTSKIAKVLNRTDSNLMYALDPSRRSSLQAIIDVLSVMGYSLHVIRTLDYYNKNDLKFDSMIVGLRKSHPFITALFSPNNTKKIDYITETCKKGVLWQCSNGHEWSESPFGIVNRLKAIVFDQPIPADGNLNVHSAVAHLCDVCSDRL